MMTARQARKKALDYAIFALNTLEAPDASSQDDLDDLDDHSHWTISHLVDMRDELQSEPVPPVTRWDKVELALTMFFDRLLFIGDFVGFGVLVWKWFDWRLLVIWIFIMLGHAAGAIHSKQMRARMRGEHVNSTTA